MLEQQQLIRDVTRATPGREVVLHLPVARYGTRPSQRTSKGSVSAMSATISHRAFTTSAHALVEAL